MEFKAMKQKVDDCKDCLAHLKTQTGRRRYSVDEDPFEMDPFWSDAAKIESSKAFRNMRDKTQVFTQPESSLVRNRLAHVLEVDADSVVVADVLGLNVTLVHSGALGHDIGHVPFGHQGEAWMQKAMGRSDFCHEIMGPIIAQKIERKGKGLNLTYETLEAMMCHSGRMAHDGMSQEAWVLRHTDKFAYIFHDVNDIIGRMEYPASAELTGLINEFGGSQRERTYTVQAGLIIESAELGRVSFQESELGRKFKRLRNLMYELYPRVTQQNVDSTMGKALECLTRLGIADPFLILALMTDRDVITPTEKPMPDMQAFRRTAVKEIVRYLPDIGAVDLCDPDMNW